MRTELRIRATMSRVVPLIAIAVFLVSIGVVLMLTGRGGEEPPRSTRASPVPSGLACAARPSTCGFPDESNTGVTMVEPLDRVPEDVSRGRGWHWDERGWVTVDGQGALLEGLEIPWTVDVVADGVVIRDVRITVGGETFGIAIRRANGTTIEDVEIGPPDSSPRLMVGIKDIYGDAQGTAVRRSEITRTSTGVQLSAGEISDNYIHSMAMSPGDHVNGVTSNGSRSPLRIVHNTVLNSIGQTDAIGLFQDFGIEANREITDNLLAGGGYVVYGGANPDGEPTSGIRIVGNRFARLYFDAGGALGPVAAFDGSGTGNVWRDNVWDDTGEVIPAP
ncbi:hypothetical protein [Georgenia yuyongxinii]